MLEHLNQLVSEREPTKSLSPDQALQTAFDLIKPHLFYFFDVQQDFLSSRSYKQLQSTLSKFEALLNFLAQIKGVSDEMIYKTEKYSTFYQYLLAYGKNELNINRFYVLCDYAAEYLDIPEALKAKNASANRPF